MFLVGDYSPVMGVLVRVRPQAFFLGHTKSMFFRVFLTSKISSQIFSKNSHYGNWAVICPKSPGKWSFVSNLKIKKTKKFFFLEMVFFFHQKVRFFRFFLDFFWLFLGKITENEIFWAKKIPQTGRKRYITSN